MSDEEDQHNPRDEEDTPEYANAPTHPMPGDDDDDDEVEENEQGDTKETEEEEDDKEVVSKLAGNKECGKRTCSVIAHNKMVLHALKHLSSAVFGLLIGVTYKEESSSSTYMHIMDAIPLQHTCFSAMLIEVAFLQIQEWLNRVCKSTNTLSKNVRVLGVYFANNHADDVDKNTSAVIIASQLMKQYSRSSLLLCQVVSERINMAYHGEDSALDWYMLRNNGNAEHKKDWRDVEDVYIVQCTQKATLKDYPDWLVNTKQLKALDVANQKFKQLNLAQMVQSNGEEKIYDFDDHLDDQSKDWRNFHLFT